MDHVLRGGDCHLVSRNDVTARSAYADGEVRQEFNVCFRGRALPGGVSGSQESMEVRFVAPAELDELAMHPRTRLRVNHALDATRTSPYIG